MVQINTLWHSGWCLRLKVERNWVQILGIMVCVCLFLCIVIIIKSFIISSQVAYHCFFLPNML